MQAIKFNQRVLHGHLQFLPDSVVAFEDVDAAPYFIKAGWADPTDEPPVHVYPLADVDIPAAPIFVAGGGAVGVEHVSHELKG